MDPTKPPSGQKQFDTPLAAAPGEQTIMEITRHPFGLFGLYLACGFIVLVLLAAAALIPHFFTSLTSQDRTGLFAGAVIAILIVLLYMYVAVTIYRGNRWVVTNDSITEISQAGLFNKKTSQLSLANLEDVTFDQNNIVQEMFGFGTLIVETAGEHSKFSFPYCPKPSSCAKSIINAHEQFIANRPQEMVMANQALVATQQYNPSTPPSPVPPAQPTDPVGYSVPTDPDDDQDQ